MRCSLCGHLLNSPDCSASHAIRSDMSKPPEDLIETGLQAIRMPDTEEGKREMLRYISEEMPSYVGGVSFAHLKGRAAKVLEKRESAKPSSAQRIRRPFGEPTIAEMEAKMERDAPKVYAMCAVILCVVFGLGFLAGRFA